MGALHLAVELGRLWLDVDVLHAQVSHVLPAAFLLEAPEEPLDDSVLFGRVGRDGFVAKSVVPASPPKSSTLENQPVVAANDGRLVLRAKRSEAPNTGLLERSFRLLRSAAKSEFVAYDLAIVTIDDRS